MNINGYGNYDHYDHQRQIVDLDDDDDDSPSLMAPRIVTTSSPSTPEVGCGVNNYIEHRVSKMDTLAGVAIKYGVEVSDIRKMNNLVTDLQMFGLKTLHIPLLVRHPPSPCLSIGSESPGYEKTTSAAGYPDLLDSFQSLKVNSSNTQKVSPVMSTLQGFYKLKSTEHKRNRSEGLEMSSYRKEDGPFPKQLLTTNPPLSRHRKCKSAANGFFSGNNLTDDIDSVKDDSNNRIEDILNRGQKLDYFGSRTPEILLKEDPSSGGFSAVKSKGLALRSKATIRNSTPTGLEASMTNNLQSGVRKSSSTSCLQDQESFGSSLWLSAAAITRPMFDGLPKPTTNLKNKAALD